MATLTRGNETRLSSGSQQCVTCVKYHVPLECFLCSTAERLTGVFELIVTGTYTGLAPISCHRFCDSSLILHASSLWYFLKIRSYFLKFTVSIDVKIVSIIEKNHETGFFANQIIKLSKYKTERVA